MSSLTFKKSVTNFYLLIFLITLSISSIVLDIKYSNSNYIRIYINDFIINPIQYLARTPSMFFSSFMIEKETIAELKEEIERLEKENMSMKINLQRLDVLESQVSRLRGIRQNLDNEIKNIKIAEITETNVIPNKKSIQINVGSNYDLIVGQTVMGVNGLLGQIVEVNMYTSKVLLITDSDSNVPAKIGRTGQQIIVKGGAEDNLLEVPFLPNDSDIKTGDLIITSGQANRFIPSLKIGRVKDVIKNDGERFIQAIIDPIEKVEKISEAIIPSKIK
ncbi:MAG: rod shape-determining protein MreC [Gammaproteobacteria bacterium]